MYRIPPSTGSAMELMAAAAGSHTPSFPRHRAPAGVAPVEDRASRRVAAGRWAAALRSTAVHGPLILAVLGTPSLNQAAAAVSRCLAEGPNSTSVVGSRSAVAVGSRSAVLEGSCSAAVVGSRSAVVGSRLAAVLEGSCSAAVV
jgi:hypothetical protein